jgi:hypothetical protein
MGKARPVWQVLLVAAAIATLAAVPARAEHVPHWYENGMLIVGSVSVEARGMMNVEQRETEPGPPVTCRDVVADWTLTNPTGGEAGIGELTRLTSSGCGSYRPRLCIAASAEIVGLPQRATLKGKRPPEEALEPVEMRAECSPGGIGVISVGGPLYVSTRRGVVHLYFAERLCGGLCHPAFAYGKFKLARNITAK